MKVAKEAVITPYAPRKKLLLPIVLDGAAFSNPKTDKFLYVDTSSGSHEIGGACDSDQKPIILLKKDEVKYIKASSAFGNKMAKLNIQVVSESDAMKELPDLGPSGQTDW